MSPKHQVNYDTVAPSYDGRLAEGYLAGIREALQKLARQVKAQHVLDMGCGTGRSLQLLDDSLPAAAWRYGLDFSRGMLAQAQKLNDNYRLVQASAPQPPFAPASFDMVFCVVAFHHFPDKTQVVKEAFRLLRPGGAFAIVNFDPRESESYLFTYFEGVHETDLERFPAIEEQEAMLRQVGFLEVKSPVVQHINASVVGEEVLQNYYLRKEACSQLILISDEVYQAGIARIKAAIIEAKHQDQAITFDANLKKRMCHGFKPK